MSIISEKSQIPTGILCRNCLSYIISGSICTECAKTHIDNLKACSKCTSAIANRTQVVSWSSNKPLSAKVLIIGQGPGYIEDRDGKPFIGPSGQKLREALLLANISEDDVVFGNRILCYLGKDITGDVTPSDIELKNCRENFEVLLSFYSTSCEYIVAVSPSAISYFITGQKISDIHGKIFNVNGYKVIPMYHPASTLYKPIRQDIVDNFFADWKKLGDILSNKSSQTSVRTPSFDYEIVSDIESLKKLNKHLLTLQCFSFDTEFTDLNPFKCKLCAISIYDGKKAFYVVLRSSEGKYLSTENIKQYLEPAFTNANIAKPTWNGKTDALVLKLTTDISVTNIDDCMIMEYLISGVGTLSLKDCSLKYLNYKMTEFNDIAKGKTYDSIPLQFASLYSCADAYTTYLHYQRLQPTVKNNERLNKLYYEIYKPVIPIIQQMEHDGAYIDSKRLSLLYSEFTETSRNIDESLGISSRSPLKVAKILYDDLKLPDYSGHRSTDREYLEKLSEISPIAKAIADSRFFAYLASNWCIALTNAIMRDDRAHTNFNLCSTVSGRLSSSNPINFQNVPRRRKEGMIIRDCYIAEKGCVILKVDISQQEPRWMAHFSQDTEMLRIFNSGSDIHSETALAVFPIECSVKEVKSKYPELRDVGKTLILAGFYGANADTLTVHAKQANNFLRTTKLPQVDTTDIKERLMSKYKALTSYRDNIQLELEKNHYIDSHFGFRREFPTTTYDDVKMACNHRIQSSSAQQILIAMIKLDKHIKQNNLMSKIVLQVHDELVLQVPISEILTIMPLIRDALINAVKLSVPIEVEISVGKSWGKTITGCKSCKTGIENINWRTYTCNLCYEVLV